MKKEEFIFNLLLGVSIISWGIAGLNSAIQEEGLSTVRILTALFNGIVGTLVIVRKPVKTSAPISAFLMCLPSLIFSGLLFSQSASFTSWTIEQEVLFGLGVTIASFSFLSLGKNFAVLPQLRSISTGGLYRIIRHPAYLGELLMLLACVLSLPTYLNSAVYVLFIPFLIIRIYAEEKVLSSNENYMTYQSIVKWRLIPFLW